MENRDLSNRYTDKILVSVLIPTKDRPQDLDACIRSVLANDHKSFEVIVIDQSPEPYAGIQDPRLHVHHSPAQGKSAALNAAMKLASGDLFAFTDDDCTVPCDWLTRGQEHMTARPDVELIFGALLAIPHNPSQWYIPAFSPEQLEVVSGAVRARYRGGAGANMFARRELFERIGGFDEAIGPGAPFLSCEEYDIYYRTLRSGGNVLRDPENAALHYGKRSHRDGASQRLIQGYFFGEGAVLAKHVRCKDLAALRVSLAIMFKELGLLVCSGLVRRNRYGIDLTARWLSGFAQGLNTPILARLRMFEKLPLDELIQHRESHTKVQTTTAVKADSIET